MCPLTELSYNPPSSFKYITKSNMSSKIDPEWKKCYYLKFFKPKWLKESFSISTWDEYVSELFEIQNVFDMKIHEAQD